MNKAETEISLGISGDFKNSYESHPRVYSQAGEYLGRDLAFETPTRIAQLREKLPVAVLIGGLFFLEEVTKQRLNLPPFPSALAIGIIFLILLTPVDRWLFWLFHPQTRGEEKKILNDPRWA